MPDLSVRNIEYSKNKLTVEWVRENIPIVIEATWKTKEFGNHVKETLDKLMKQYNVSTLHGLNGKELSLEIRVDASADKLNLVAYERKNRFIRLTFLCKELTIKNTYDCNGELADYIEQKIFEKFNVTKASDLIGKTIV